jgi:sugar transferase (PEP-CTERM/EpsH1 system associated)
MGTLRIVHVINLIVPSGGMEKGLAMLIRRGSPDLEHVVITIEGAREPERVLPHGTRLIDLRKPPGHSWRFIWQLSRLLRELSPCVVHTRNWPGVDGVIAARLAGIRSVVHSEEGWGMLDMLGQSRKRILVRRFMSRWTRNFLSVSKDIERWLTDTVRVRCPVLHIHNGIDSDAYAGPRTSAELKAELGLPADALLVGIVARLDPIKDHPTLFRAFRHVRERVPQAVLLCVGDGAERENLRRIVTPGIRMLGERHDVPRILRGLDVSVLVSRNEGASYTILEAMAAGLPVVASRVGGNPELVIDGVTGGLFPAGDEAALADALVAYLVAPETRAAHGAAARERALRLYGTDEMVKAYEDTWRACAGEVRGSRGQEGATSPRHAPETPVR